MFQAFLIGANFPWVDCGHDFGPRPVGWGTALHPWAQVSEDLRQLRTLGVRVVRWWILAGGVNYPVGGSIEEVANVVRRRGLTVGYRFKPGESPPALGEAFVRDFEALCMACESAGVQLMPSLLSFEWFMRAKGRSRGRRDLVFGDGMYDQTLAFVARFLDATLEPLLSVTARHLDAIFAWDVINEPDWVVTGGPSNLARKLVSAAEMNLLLASAIERIVQSGACATVGFKQLAPAWLAPQTVRLMQNQASQGRYVHQLHHYPTLVTDRKLPPVSASPIRPCIVGEFPSAQGSRFGGLLSGSLHPTNWVFGDREARDSERDPHAYLRGRLSLIQQRGYDGAFVWATPPAWLQRRDSLARGNRPSSDVRVTWGDRQREQVRAFASAQGEWPGPDSPTGDSGPEREPRV